MVYLPMQLGVLHVLDGFLSNWQACFSPEAIYLVVDFLHGACRTECTGDDIKHGTE